MSSSNLLWMPSVLRAAGLKVGTCDGWEDRGDARMGPVLGVMCHHTAGRRDANMPSLHVLMNGRTGVPGPLAQLGLARDGTYYVIAAGRANHAGRGAFRSITSGNRHFLGIEAQNTGKADDQPWPEVQMDAYRRGVAALLGHLGAAVDFCIGHGEWALPRGRKVDPSFDMSQFRADVARIMRGEAPGVALIPRVEPAPRPGRAPRSTLRRGGEQGALVAAVQVQLGIEQDGVYGPITEARVRAFQRSNRLVPDGIVGPKTWSALDATRDVGAVGQTVKISPVERTG